MEGVAKSAEKIVFASSKGNNSCAFSTVNFDSLKSFSSLVCIYVYCVCVCAKTYFVSICHNMKINECNSPKSIIMAMQDPMFFFLKHESHIALTSRDLYQIYHFRYCPFLPMWDEEGKIVHVKMFYVSMIV
jgi:hypothetical protein